MAFFLFTNSSSSVTHGFSAHWTHNLLLITAFLHLSSFPCILNIQTPFLFKAAIPFSSPGRFSVSRSDKEIGHNPPVSFFFPFLEGKHLGCSDLRNLLLCTLWKYPGQKNYKHRVFAGLQKALAVMVFGLEDLVPGWFQSVTLIWHWKVGLKCLAQEIQVGAFGRSGDILSCNLNLLPHFCGRYGFLGLFIF